MLEQGGGGGGPQLIQGHEDPFPETFEGPFDALGLGGGINTSPPEKNPLGRKLTAQPVEGALCKTTTLEMIGACSVGRKPFKRVCLFLS